MQVGLCPSGEQGICVISPAQPAPPGAPASLPLTPVARSCRAPPGPSPSQLRVRRQAEHGPEPRSPSSGCSQVPYVLQRACGTSPRRALRSALAPNALPCWKAELLRDSKLFCGLFLGKGGKRNNVIRLCHLHPRQMMSCSG